MSELITSLPGVVVLARTRRRLAHIALGAYLTIAGLTRAITGTVTTSPGRSS